MLHRKLIPNYISVLRALAVAPIIGLLLHRQFDWALAAFVLAGLSDGLDGWLAARFGWRTALGGILDPLADKLLLVGSFLALWWIGLTPGWLLVLVLLRDVVIVAGATAYHFRVAPLRAAPTRLSKLNTVVQLAYVCGIITVAAFGWRLPALAWLGTAAVTLTTLASGLHYVVVWGRKTAAHKR